MAAAESQVEALGWQREPKGLEAEEQGIGPRFGGIAMGMQGLWGGHRRQEGSPGWQWWLWGDRLS